MSRFKLQLLGLVGITAMVLVGGVALHSNEEPALQASSDNASQPLSSAEKELKASGYSLLVLNYPYVTVQYDQTTSVRQWYGGKGTTRSPHFFYTLADMIVGVQVIEDGMRCDVPASSQSVLVITADFQMYEARQQGRAWSGRPYPYEPKFVVGSNTYYCN